MKIITHTSKNGESVYIQVKDLLYLGRVFGKNTYIDEYIGLLNSQKSDYDFVKVNDNDKKTIICKSDIIDFKEAYRESSTFLARTLINLSFSSPFDETSKQKSEDIRDVLAFKRGELPYSIPLLNDGEISYESNDGLLSFSSTIIPDCFSLRTIDYSDIKSCDYQEFLSNCLNNVKKSYADMDENIYEMNNMIVIRFNKSKKANRMLTAIKKAKKRVFKNEE